VCITFCPKNAATQREQYLLTDYQKRPENNEFRGFSIINNALRLYGVDNKDGFLSIPLKTRNDDKSWYTLTVNWGSYKFGGESQYSLYRYQNIIHSNISFKANKLPLIVSAFLGIGGILGEDNKPEKYFDGVISNVDICSAPSSALLFPSKMLDVIIQKNIVYSFWSDFERKQEEDEPPALKRKKVT
jgi:hypothetical protein